MQLKLIHEAIPGRKIDHDSDDVEFVFLDDYDINSDDDSVQQALANRMHCDLDDVFTHAGIRISNSKKFTIAALVKGDAIGGISSEVYTDNDTGEHIYSFDVAVDPSWQGYQDVGRKLIDMAIYEAKKARTHIIRLFVINRKLADFLDGKYGFEGNSDHEEDGRWHPVVMEKYL